MTKIISAIYVIMLTLNIAQAGSPNKHNAATLTYKNIIVPEAPPVASVMVAYMKITNSSNKKQTIKHIHSPQFKRVEIHKMSMANGMMNMEQLASLSIKAKQSIELEPGGLHLMLIKPIKPLKDKNNVELTFELLSGELTTVNTQVKRIE